MSTQDKGFGIEGAPASWAELDELNKALSATYGYEGAPTALTGGGVLQVESLDATMKSVTFEEQHLKLWPMIPKARAFNTVEEINRIKSYGDMPEGMGFFDAEAQVLPPERDPAFSREVLKVRYIGDTRIVTHPATLVRTSGESMMAIQARTGTINVLAMLERALFRASGFKVEAATGKLTGDPVDVHVADKQFQGIEQQIRYGDTDADAQYTGFEGYDGDVSVIYDLEGQVPDPDDLEEAGRRSAENWGVPTHCLMAFKCHSDISRQYMLKERVNPLGVANGQAGYVLLDFFSSAGIFKLVGSRFLSPKRTPLATAQNGAPNTPVVTGIAFEGDTDSKLEVATYSYRVSALNNAGESLASAQQTVAIAANQRAVITIAAGTTGAIYYAIYRAPKDTTVAHEFVGFVKDSGANGGAGVVARERGERSPGLQTAYLMSISEKDVRFYQLAPLMKMDLAVISPALRFMVLLYGAPWVFAPKHHVLIDNIGRS
jgi:hypothetical protein